MPSARFKVVVLAVLTTIFSQVSAAEDYHEYAKDLVDREKEIRGNAKTILGDFPIKPEISDDALSLARDVVSRSMDSYKSELDQVKKDFDITLPDRVKAVDDEGEWVNILISRSLGESTLKQIMASVEGYDVPVRFVFRGIPEGATINDSMRDFASWSRDLPSRPEAVLNPTLFSDSQVENVPRMMWMDAGNPIASVDGITNPKWLKNQIDLGEKGYLGVRGPVEEISERNLIEVMKEKMLGIDLMAKKQESIDTYFERTQFIYLPEAKEDRTRYIDPSVVVQKALRNAKGEVVIPAGAGFNPLTMRPFTLRLIVFNPSREEELEWLADLERENYLKDMYIASELDGARGWDQLQAAQDMIDDNIFLLKTDVWQRFDIEKTPSIVTSEGLMFRIDEINLDKSEEDKQQQVNKE